MAKKKKEVVEQVETNEIQEDIIDMMKEVSMQPEVDVPTDEEVIDESNGLEIIENETPEETTKEIVEQEISEDAIENESEEIVNDKLPEETKDEHDTSKDNNLEIDKLIEEVHKNNDCNCNSKPRMSWQQMMGYDWNGQNFEI